MKTLVIAFAVLLTGCGSIPLLKPSQTIVTNTTPAGPVFVTNTTFEVSTPVAATIDTIKSVNQAVPWPGQPIVSGVLGLVSLGLAAYARKKSNDSSLLKTVVGAIETLPADTDPKQHIKAVATMTGQQAALDRFVQSTV